MPPPARVDSCCLGTCPCHCSARPPTASPTCRRPTASATTLAEQMTFQIGRRASPAECRSWERSLPALAADLREAGLGDVEVLVEYQLPLTSKRADVVLAGRHPRTRRPVVRRRRAQAVDAGRAVRGRAPSSSSSSTLRTRGRSCTRSPQVRGYCEYLLGLHSRPRTGRPDVARRRRVPAQRHRRSASAALLQLSAGRARSALHRAASRRVPGLPREPALAPNAARRTPTALLRRRSRRASSCSPSRPRRSASASSSCCSTSSGSRTTWCCTRWRRRDGRPQERRRRHRRPGQRQERHRAVAARRAVPAGSDGRARDRVAVVHPDPAQGRRRTGSRGSQTLFKYFNSSWTLSTNGLDVLIADEAHRIRETSVNRYTPGPQHRTGRAAGRRAARRRPGAGVPAGRAPGRAAGRDGHRRGHREARPRARARGPPRRPRRPVPLRRQSQEYVDWVERLLGLEPGGPVPWNGDERLRGPGRRLAVRDGGTLSRARSPTALQRPHGRRLLLAVERPRAGRVPGPRRGDRRLGAPVEPQGRPRGRRCAAGRALGQRPGRLRSGRLRLHRAGLRVRLERRHHRPRPGLAQRTAGSPSARPTGPGLPQHQARSATRTSTAWSATSTRCCSPAACGACTCTRPTRRRSASSPRSSAEGSAAPGLNPARVPPPPAGSATPGRRTTPGHRRAPGRARDGGFAGPSLPPPTVAGPRRTTGPGRARRRSRARSPSGRRKLDIRVV